MSKTHDIMADLPATLQLECGTTVEWSEVAAAGDGAEKTPKFAMLAYTGGAMRVGGFYRPVVVDLAGVKVIGKTLPIFRQHDPLQIVGHGEAAISANEIRAEGLVSADNEHSRDIVSSSRKGFPWQASIGASVEEFEQVKEGQKVIVNGRTIAGPVLVARKSTLSEISFVPLGADRRTSAKVSAKQQQTPDLPAGIRISAAGNKTGVWIEGSGTAFLSAAELKNLLNQLRS